MTSIDESKSQPGRMLNVLVKCIGIPKLPIDRRMWTQRLYTLLDLQYMKWMLISISHKVITQVVPVKIIINY